MRVILACCIIATYGETNTTADPDALVETTITTTDITSDAYDLSTMIFESEYVTTRKLATTTSVPPPATTRITPVMKRYPQEIHPEPKRGQKTEIAITAIQYLLERYKDRKEKKKAKMVACPPCYCAHK